MANPSNAANVWDAKEVLAAARADVASFEIRRTVDIAGAFA
jgi:hypothetical protein